MSIFGAIQQAKNDFRAQQARREGSNRRKAEEELTIIKAKRAMVEEDTKVFNELENEKAKLKIAESNRPKTGIVGKLEAIKKKKAEFKKNNPEFGKPRGVFTQGGNGGGGFF